MLRKTNKANLNEITTNTTNSIASGVEKNIVNLNGMGIFLGI